MPYIRRDWQLKNTLLSYRHWYLDREDWQVVIIEDGKNAKNPLNHRKLEMVCDEFKDLRIVNICFHVDSINPCSLFNLGAGIASGEFLILTSPEVFHEADILSGLDQEFEEHRDKYIVCGCESRTNCNPEAKSIREIKGQHRMWYQHSAFRDYRFHFCTALAAENYTQIGGFDEDYAPGYCFDDNDFRNKVGAFGLPFILRDDLVTVHQEHDKHRPKNWKQLWDRNRQLYRQKWGQEATID